MRRRVDWVERLNAYLHEVREARYDPAAHNCATFVRGALMAMTGEDAAVELGVEVPSTAAGAARVLIERRGVRGLAEAYFGLPANPNAQLARRGDVVIAPAEILVAGADDREALGLADSAQAFFVTPDGMSAEPLKNCIGFWRVG